MYTDEKGTFILRWAITRNGKRIVAKNKPFKIYISKNKQVKANGITSNDIGYESVAYV